MRHLGFLGCLIGLFQGIKRLKRGEKFSPILVQIFFKAPESLIHKGKNWFEYLRYRQLVKGFF